MAANVILTPAPGLTVETTLDVRLSGTGYDVILASTSAQPTFAKNIAYDEFGNPFISVVQDGRGNVFFDGGFPKYYNTYWNGQASFSVLSNQLKLLYNAFKWCAEGRSAPTKRVLLFGDKLASEGVYAVKGTDPNGFITTFQGVGGLAGYTVDVRDFLDYPQPSNIPYETMAQYDVIIFMSSWTLNPETARLSAQTLSNLQTYRQQGGGIMIITDHNVFQTTANEVAGLFNCSFSGNVDRHPVSVDALVATYGMHPLWANMTGDVYAGGSEGIVTIPSMTPFNPATDKLTITGPGYRTIYLTISDTAGTVTTYAYSYAMNVPEPVSGTMPTATSYKYLDLPFEIIRLNNTDTSGTITVDGTLIGSFIKRSTGAVSKTFTGNFPKPCLTTNKKTIDVSVRITVPVIYDKTYKVTLTPVDITSVRPSKRWASMQKNEMLGIMPKSKLIRKLQDEQSLVFTGGTNAAAARAVNNYYSTHYRTAGERTAVVEGWIDNGTYALQNWGYDGRQDGYGTINSQAPIFSNQIVCYFANFTDRTSGVTTFSVAFRRSDNATQVIGNFTGRRVRLADKNGTIYFDEEISSAVLAQADTVGSYNTFLFNWTIPTSIMRTSGASWNIQVV